MSIKNNSTLKKLFKAFVIFIIVYLILLITFVANKKHFKDNYFVRMFFYAPMLVLTPIDSTLLDNRIGICINNSEDEWFDVDGHKMYIFTIPLTDSGEIYDNEMIKKLKTSTRINTAWYAFWYKDRVVLGFPYEGLEEPVSEIDFGYKRALPAEWCRTVLFAKKITDPDEFYKKYLNIHF